MGLGVPEGCLKRGGLMESHENIQGTHKSCLRPCKLSDAYVRLYIFERESKQVPSPFGGCVCLL